MPDAISNPTAARTAIRDAPESLKDTIESIVVALILAFVFRAFIVEAFVIPTGSMAPTLYGAHGTILCEDCGVEFAYGLRDPEDTRKGQQVLNSSEAVCPNCGHANRYLPYNDEIGNPDKGDRILVLKWPFDIDGGLLGPHRWDVVVFKDPSDGVTNFIKRLIGLPNEVLMLLDGDVFTVPIAELSDEARREFERYVDEKYAHLNSKRAGPPLMPVGPDVFAELDGKLAIRRKTPEAQAALWMLVYDHDHPPRTLDRSQPRWRPQLGEASGWRATDRRIEFVDAGRPGDYLELVGRPIQATNAYNIYDGPSPPYVSDVRVSFVWIPEGADASVHVRLAKHRRPFWATVSADGRVSLSSSASLPVDDRSVMAMEQLPAFVLGRAVEIAFQNVDYRLSVQVAGEDVVGSSADPESKAYYGPNVRALRNLENGFTRARNRDVYPSEPPRIYGSNGDFDLTHLLVQRDVHYFHNDRFASFPTEPWAPSTGWGSSVSPIYLRQGEYFMLGDNTAASKDSRLWDERGQHLIDRGSAFQLGTVPRDQMIGKAFFVYWPSGQRLDWLPIPILNRLGLIPDVGKMRWIR